MGLKAQAKADIEQITSNLDGWGEVLTLTAKTGEVAVINGLHTKHHISQDTEGNQIHGKNAHASFSEKFLIDAGYPVRDANMDVIIKDDLLEAMDSTGVICKYQIVEVYPDETVGLIAVILADFE